jgi:hypothetical protein
MEYWSGGVMGHLSITPSIHCPTSSPRAWNFKETGQYKPNDSDSDGANDPARNR